MASDRPRGQGRALIRMRRSGYTLRRPMTAPRILRPIAACLLLLLPLGAHAASLRQLVREADLILTTSLPATAQQGDLVGLGVERVLKRTGAFEQEVPTRLPPALRRLPEGTRLLLFLTSDARDPGAHALLDPEAGALRLDGSAGNEADLLAAVSLALDESPGSAAYVPALAALLGRGDAVTGLALELLLEREELARNVPRADVERLWRVVTARRVSPQTAALAIDLLAAVRPPQADVLVIDLIAGETPDVVVDAAVRAMARLADPGTAQQLLHAVGGAPDAAVPGLLRLMGAARTRELLPHLHERLGASRSGVRLAALAALAEIGDASSVPMVEPLLEHEDPRTREAARGALEAILQAKPAAP